MKRDTREAKHGYEGTAQPKSDNCGSKQAATNLVTLKQVAVSLDAFGLRDKLLNLTFR
jgi:hypothetical protein